MNVIFKCFTEKQARLPTLKSFYMQSVQLSGPETDSASFFFTSIHYENTSFSRILKMSLTITTRRTGETNHFM